MNLEMKAKNGEAKVLYSRKGKCLVEGCDREIEARQLCEKHYARMRRRGTIHTKIIERNSIENCLAPGCSQPYYANGYCKHHNNNYKNLGYPYMAKVIKLCGVEDCSNYHFLFGHCETHFIEWEASLKKYGLEKQIQKN
jgi:hypothetical protein